MTASPTRTRVAVVGGGQSCEHEVSLASAAAVAHALDPSRYEAVPLTIGPDGRWSSEGTALSLAQAVTTLQSCAVTFPAVHGPRGEDGTLAALCELAGVPYVGSGVGAGALAMDKWATKLVAEAVGVATAPGHLVTAESAARYVWSHPVVVKPVAAGSSHGVRLVERPEELPGAFAAALALDDRVLVEDVVVGREIDIAVLQTGAGPVTSPSLEVAVDGWFDFDAKYRGGAEFVIPAALGPRERGELEEVALTIFEALGCRSVARIDFFVTGTGLVLNEVNTMPGFTEQSQVPKMFAAAGLGYPELLDLLIRHALPG